MTTPAQDTMRYARVAVHRYDDYLGLSLFLLIGRSRNSVSYGEVWIMSHWDTVGQDLRREAYT